jgi:hypothetical protein
MSLRERLLGRLHFVLVLAGLTAVVCGLIVYKPLGQPLWNSLGRRHFLTFLAIVSPVMMSLPWILRSRWPVGAVVLAVVAIILTCGPAATLTLAYMVVSSICLGHLLLGQFVTDREDTLTSVAIDAILGFALLSLFLNVAVHFPINTRRFYIVVLGVPIVPGHRHVADLWRRFRTWLAAPTEVRTSAAWLGSLLGLILLIHLVMVAMPERYYDALAMHLRICTTVAHERCWHFDCANFAPAAMPMNGDLFFAVGYLLGGETGARLVNFLFFLVVVTLLYGEVRVRCGTCCALLSAALFASLPVAFLETASLFVENELTAFLLAAFVVLARLDRQPRRGSVLAMAVLLGAAVSTKLHGFIAAVLFGALTFGILLRQRGVKQACALLLPAAMVVAVVGAPPYLTACWKTGNPVFPFYNAVFKSPYFPSATNFVDAHWGRIHWGLVYDLTFQTHRYLEAMDGAAGFYFLALGAAGAIMCCLRRDRIAVLALSIGVAYLIASGLFVGYLRYFYPVLPLLTLAIVGPGLSDGGAKWARWATYAAGVVLIGLNVFFMPSAAWILSTFDCQAVLSREQRTQVLDLSVPERRLVEVVNRTAGDQAHVLFIGAPYATGLEGKAYFANWYAPALLQAILEARQPEDIERVLENAGITHILVSPGAELPNAAVFSVVQDRHMKLLATLNGASVYALRSADPASRPTNSESGGAAAGGVTSLAQHDSVLQSDPAIERCEDFFGEGDTGGKKVGDELAEVDAAAQQIGQVCVGQVGDELEAGKLVFKDGSIAVEDNS